MKTRRTIWSVVFAGGALLLLPACGKSAPTTDVASGSTSTSDAARAGSSGVPATSRPNTGTTCVPMSTLAPMPGQPSTSVKTTECGPIRPPTSTATTDATQMPVTTNPGGRPNPTTSLVPDASRGVIQGTLVEQVQCVTDPCPPQPIAGNVLATADTPETAPANRPAPPPTVAVREVPAGQTFGFLLGPGTYTLKTTTASHGNCPPTKATVTAGQVTKVTIVCTIS